MTSGVGSVTSTQQQSTVNYDNVVKAKDSQLAHVPNKIVSPKIHHQRSRDLGIYMQTEALKNVLNDNYRQMIDEDIQLQILSERSKKALQIRAFSGRSRQP